MALTISQRWSLGVLLLGTAFAANNQPMLGFSLLFGYLAAREFY